MHLPDNVTADLEHSKRGVDLDHPVFDVDHLSPRRIWLHSMAKNLAKFITLSKSTTVFVNGVRMILGFP